MLGLRKSAVSLLSVVCAVAAWSTGAYGAPAANGDGGLQEALRNAGQVNKQFLMKVGANW